jgi:hypothetical protein
MAYPIQPTHIVYGKSASDFFKTLKENESKFANKSEILRIISIYNHQKENYKKLNSPF